MKKKSILDKIANKQYDFVSETLRDQWYPFQSIKLPKEMETVKQAKRL